MRYMKHLTLALLIVAVPGAGSLPAQTPDWEVPGDGDLDHVINNLASPGELVEVSNKNGNNDPYDPITMQAGVTVYAASGQSPKISGSGADYAVDFPTDATSTTVLEGFTEITRGTVGAIRVRGSGVVRDCTITVASSSNGPAVRSIGTTTLEGLQVTVTGTGLADGIEHTGGSPAISGCQVTIGETTNQSSVGISVDAGSATTAGTVEDCVLSIRMGTGFSLLDGSYTIRDNFVDFTAVGENNIGVECGYTTSEGGGRYTISDCFISVPAGIGMYVLDDSAKVSNVTVVGVGTGIWGFGAHPVVRNCIVADYNDVGYEYAFYYVDPQYCIADGTRPWYGTSDTTGSKNEDPLFCDAAGGEYSLRIDSWGNPANNGNGLIGAYPVACAYGELVRSTTVGEDADVLVTADVTVPSGMTLTMEPRSVFRFDAEDDGESGQDTALNELIVRGTLDVDGTAGNEVEFTSSSGSPAEGDWHGIFADNASTVQVDYAKVSYAVRGIEADSTIGNSIPFIKHSVFEHNQSRDILVRGPVLNSYMTIEGNDITVGEATGIELTGNCSYVIVSGNTISGSSSSPYSTNGILLTHNSGSPAVTGNTVEGFITAYPLKIEGGSATVTQNSFKDGTYGIWVDADSVATPLLGTTSGSSDNVIESNTNGIRSEGSGSSPVIRNNQIKSNGSGIVTSGNSVPFIGATSDDAKNSIWANSSYCIWNRNSSAGITNAGNWFGSCAAPGCTNGVVVTLSWLCSQPASGPAPDLVVLDPARGLALLAPRPNPMAAGTAISFALDGGSAAVQLRIFDAAGRLVREWPAEHFGPGTHTVDWDGTDSRGDRVSTGMYFVQAAAGGRLVQSAKLLVAR